MQKIAITGLIGSGKSTVCKVFERLGVAVFNSDAVAKDAYFEPSIHTEVLRLFGQEAFFPDGRLNNAFLAESIFRHQEQLTALNKLIHPYVMDRFHLFCQEKEGAYVLFESAIVFQSGLEHFFDRIIAIATPQEEVIERVISRNGLTEQTVKERIDKQKGFEVALKKADFIIYNAETDLIVPQILTIHQILSRKIG